MGPSYSACAVHLLRSAMAARLGCRGLKQTACGSQSYARCVSTSFSVCARAYCTASPFHHFAKRHNGHIALNVPRCARVGRTSAHRRALLQVVIDVHHARCRMPWSCSTGPACTIAGKCMHVKIAVGQRHIHVLQKRAWMCARCLSEGAVIVKICWTRSKWDHATSGMGLRLS